MAMTIILSLQQKKVDAYVYEPESGRLMEIITDQPGLQFYSGSGIAWKKSLTLGTKRQTPGRDLHLRPSITPTVRIIRNSHRQYLNQERVSIQERYIGFQ